MQAKIPNPTDTYTPEWRTSQQNPVFPFRVVRKRAKGRSFLAQKKGCSVLSGSIQQRRLTELHHEVAGT
jgi:hypothetical protein